MLNILANALFKWKKSPTYIQELLHSEARYAEFFHNFISQSALKDDEDIIPYATEQFKQAHIQSFKNICTILDQHQVPGHKIYDLMADERFILRKDRKDYNRQIKGKQPKGLKQAEWELYNHWLLTNIYWDALVWSQGTDFDKLIKEAARKDDLFSSNEIKPLWAMWIKGLEAEIPPVGVNGDHISLYLSV